MNENEILPILCGGFFEMSAYDLLMFGLGSFVLISILLFYYNRIPKSNNSKSELQNPIYQTKNILLQPTIENANYLTTEKTTSSWAKAFVYLMILVVIFTPIYKLLGTGYFL